MADKYVNATGLRAVIDWVLSKFTKKEDFEGLEIGGRNLAQKTSNNYTIGYSNFNGGENVCPNIGIVLTDGLEVGDTVTVRLIHKYIDIVPETDKNAMCWVQGYGNNTGWGSGQLVSSSHYYISGSGVHEILYKFTVNENHLKNTYWNVNFRHDYVKSGTSQWKLFKVEKGNKATDWTPAPEDLAPSGHTHNYAGASTAGGSATSAVKLDTSAGSATKPVYFSGGKPVECSYSLQKSVPSDAVFTDTNTWRGIQDNLNSDSTTDSLSAAQGKALKALVDGKAASNHTHTKSQITDLSTYAPIYNGNILNISEMGTYSCHPDDCTNLPSEIISWCYITMYQFRDSGYKRFICIALNNIDTNAKLGAIWLASEAYKDSNGNLIWSKTSDNGHADRSSSLYMPRVQSDANWLPDTGERTMMREFSSASVNLPNSAWYHILANRSADLSYGSQLAIGMTTDDLYYRCYYAGSFSAWHRAGVDVVIGTSSGTIAYKSGYTKAVMEFWKTTVGSASRTVYNSAIITGLSSSMTAVNGRIVSDGADFAFVYSISAGGAITPSGNFTKYKITYYN